MLNKPRLRNCAGLLDTRARKWALIVVAGLFVLGCLYALALGSHLPYIDEIDYQAIAENLVKSGQFSNDGIEPNADRAPILPLAMAATLALGAQVPHWRIMNFAFYCATLWLLNRLVSRLRAQTGAEPKLCEFGGLLAIGLGLAYPVLFYSAGTLFPQTIGAFFFVLVLYVLARDRSWSSMLWAGGIYGILLLTIPMFLFTLPILLLWLAMEQRDWWMRPAVFIVSCALVVSPWTIRNYMAFDMFVPLTSSSGAALLWGNAPEATIGGAEVDYLQAAYEQSGNLNQAQADKYRLKLALEQMRGRELAVVGFYFYKVLNHFSFVNDHYAKSEISVWRTLIMACTYCPLLAIFVARIACWKRFRPTSFEVLLIAIYIGAAFAYAIFHTRIRYRLPYDYALIAVVALFITQWLASASKTGTPADVPTQ